MRKAPPRFYLAFICMIFIVSIMGASLAVSSGIRPTNPPTEPKTEPRPDLIVLDGMAVFGKLEKAPVEFYHQTHVQEMAKINKDCSTCHVKKDDRIYPLFKRTENSDRKTLMNIYHTGCISCHGEMTLAKEKSGPIECDDCHVKKKRIKSSRIPMKFDRSLHFRHTKAAGNKCEICHHEYDHTRKKLYYEKGKEGSCRYCHKEKTIENRISMPLASHVACVNCHLTARESLDKKPPISCAGCHDQAEQEKIQVLTDIPRLERNQPDMTILDFRPPDSPASDPPPAMPFTAFDHKAHESSSETCRACHHDSLETCSKCHTRLGSDRDSKADLLETAMHKPDSSKSCIGCHNVQKKKADCAGCHSFMSKRGYETDKAACIRCHQVMPDQIKANATPEVKARIAARTLESARKTAHPMPDEDVPEYIKIDRLSSQYKGVEFPHRKIIRALEKKISQNRLAAFYHPESATVCQGCHHNSPASPQPPKCSNCHFKSWDDSQALKPGIIGAYHQQCMGCHEQMGIEQPKACIECHEPKQ